MRLIAQTFLIILCCAAFQFAAAQPDTPIQTGKMTALPKNAGTVEKKRNAIIETEKIIAEVVEKSFPELHGAKIPLERFTAHRTIFDPNSHFRGS